MENDDGLVIGHSEGAAPLLGEGPHDTIYNPNNGRTYRFVKGFLKTPGAMDYARDLIAREKV
jgi:hypothetical protein